MILDGLKNLYLDMKKQNIERYRFEYKNGKAEFDVFFFIDETPFILLFGAKGGNFSFEIEVHKGFRIKTMLDNETYKKLVKYLDLKYNPNNPFKISNFFKDFNTKIPQNASKKNIAKPEQIIKYQKNVEEVDKIYFWKWLDNSKSGKKVSQKNLEKTRKLLGKRAYEICKEKNISSCWTDDINKRNKFYLP